MSGGPLLELLLAATSGSNLGMVESQVVALLAETLAVSKRVKRSPVRATTTTETGDVVVEESLAREQVVMERVPINRVVEAVPSVRQEGGRDDPVRREEEIVIQRCLILKEEIHFRRVHSTQRYTEMMPLIHYANSRRWSRERT